jgi:hypothetical protein
MNDDNRNDSFDAPEEDLTEYIGKDENSKSLVLPKQQMPRRMYVLPVSNTVKSKQPLARITHSNIAPVAVQ